MQFSFWKPHFWHPPILQKHYFDTLLHYLRFQNYPQNTIKMGKTVKTNLDQFLTLSLDQFLTLKPPILDQFLTLQHAYIYIYICIIG